MSISQNKLLCTFKKYILKVLCMMSSEYVHIKTGNKYKVLFISNEHSGRSGFLGQSFTLVKMVLYTQDLLLSSKISLRLLVHLKCSQSRRLNVRT